MRLRKMVLGAAVLVMAMLSGACAGEAALDEDTAANGQAPAGTEEAAAGTEGGPAQTVIVGSANFTEQLIMAQMYAQVVEDLGVPVQTRLNLGSREIVFPALENGEINLLPEYNGALLAFLGEGESEARAPEEVTTALREALPDGIVALEPSEAQDKDGLAVLPETAEQYDLDTYSSLAPVAGELVVGGPAEMEEREVGLPGLRDVYGIEFADFRALDAGGPLTAAALRGGDIDVGRVFTTQGIIDEEGWVLLEDDMDLAPAQNIIPVAREEILTPEITAALDELSATLTTEDLTELNRRVDIDAEDPDAVAADYLEEKGLLGG